MMVLPKGAAFVMDKLTAAGYQAYAVGGCVRDSLLGREPKDWDVCTSATPEDMQQVFRGCHVVETGLQHGTLTVVVDHIPYEVTTFRVDGDYTDHRHPDRVTFVTDVREDLSRRDFTVNAMAYHPDTGIVDAFGGQEDLAAGIIRCVGDAQTRFEEDALRILRALRFASVYGFDIEAQTAEAAHMLKHTLRGVAAERIRVEMGKLLCGRAAGSILREYADVLCVVMPAMENLRHDGTWAHIGVVDAAAPVEALRWAALLYPAGVAATRQIMADMRMDNATRDRVLLMAEHHAEELSSDSHTLRHALNHFGEDALRQLMALQRAKAAAGYGTYPERIDGALDALLQTNPCVTLRQLAVSGGDLMAAGVPKGKMVGQCLNHLLNAVLDERLPNDKAVLLAEAAAWQVK